MNKGETNRQKGLSIGYLQNKYRLTLVLGDEMSPVEDSVPGLQVEQVELHRVTLVHVAVGVEEPPLQDHRVRRLHAQLAQRAVLVQPVD